VAGTRHGLALVLRRDEASEDGSGSGTGEARLSDGRVEYLLAHGAAGDVFRAYGDGVEGVGRRQEFARFDEARVSGAGVREFGLGVLEDVTDGCRPVLGKVCWVAQMGLLNRNRGVQKLGWMHTLLKTRYASPGSERWG
jgi:hypothetical protein